MSTRFRYEHEHGAVVLVGEDCPLKTKVGQIGEGGDGCRRAEG